MRAVILALLAALAGAQAFADDRLPSTTARVALSTPAVLGSGPFGSTKSLIDPSGQGHVVAFSEQPRALIHFTLRPSGEVTRDVIDPKAPDGEPSIAMGADGHLRVAINGHVYLQNADGWKSLNDAPPCSELARAGDSIVCAFLAKNTTPRQNGKWIFGIFGVGAAGGCCLPWAWYVRNHTLFVAREDSLDHWSSIPLSGPPDLPDAGPNYTLAGTSDGIAHVLYSESDIARFMGIGGHSINLYIRLSAMGPMTPAPASADALRSIERTGEPLADYVPDGTPEQPCIAVSPDNGDVLLMVAGRSPYIQHPGAPIERHKEFAGLPCHQSGGNLSADSADAIHVTTIVDHRASVRHGPDYFDLCYRYGRPGRWGEPVGLGRVDRKSIYASSRSIALTSDGHGRALITWVRPGNSLVGRWISTAALASSTELGPEDASEEDVDVQQHCLAHRPSWLDVGFRTAPDRSLPADESVKATFEPVYWFGTANGIWAQAKLIAAGTVPTGTVVVTERALYFTSDDVAHADKVEPKEVRLLLADIASVTQESFGRNHWVRVRRRDGVDQCFNMSKGAGIDATAVREAVALLQSAIGAPTKQ